jgi:hypothetical protein
MGKTRRLINKRTVLRVLLLVVALYVADVYVRYRSLCDDDLVMELIMRDERVEYEHVRLDRASQSPGFTIVFGSGSTLYVRYFTAWEHPPDEVSAADNYKQHGWVDMRRRVYVSDPLKGDMGFI